MLRSLSIQNYALIDSLHFEPGAGLNIITGETGAGKSILLGALGLVLGDRADASTLRDIDKKCVVEAIFDVSRSDLAAFFEENDIDYDPQTLVRREILPGGKSRAFVNDVPVVLPVLKQLGVSLADIHSQHESIGIFEKSRQLQMLDAFADHADLLLAYKNTFKEWKKILYDIDQLELLKTKADAEADYKSFLFDELELAGLKPGEFALLEEELEWLGNAESLQGTVEECVYWLKENETNAGDLVKTAIARLSRQSGSHGLAALLERLRQTATELDDIARELETVKEKIVADPGRLLQVQDRIGLLQKLFLKHKVNNEDALIAVMKDLDQQIQLIQDSDQRLDELKKAAALKQSQCAQMAETLSEKRIETAKKLSERVNQLLIQLSLPNARFDIQISELNEYNDHGRDSISFLFNANRGGTLQTLSKVASGGELSRLMLVLKSILAEKLQLPTLILDEIDSGISGEVALAMARMINQVSKDMQVIAITHLPQMASKGQFHFHVFKEETSGRTLTRITALNEQEKLLEIAKMISGNQPGESALAHARELMMG